MIAPGNMNQSRTTSLPLINTTQTGNFVSGLNLYSGTGMSDSRATKVEKSGLTETSMWFTFVPKCANNRIVITGVGGWIQSGILRGTCASRTKIANSEFITLMILFHSGCFRNMKHFHEHYVKLHLSIEFPNTVFYNLFTELMQSAILPLSIFMKTCCLGECSGITYVDSTPIRVCKNKRINRNKVFKGITELGKSSMGFFFGLNLH